MKQHPIQPLETDKHGTLRFKQNAIVNHLLNNGGIDLNQLACIDFSQEDREQFAQLIGYSLGGFSELSYVSDVTYATASKMSGSEESYEQARITALEEMLREIKEGLRSAACVAFGTHPDDLK